MPLQATSGAASYDAFGGGVPVVPNYIEEVFSTYLYTGNGSTQTITNGIDLSTKGGLVWIKARTDTSGGATSHALVDTVRGSSKWLSSNATSAEATNANLVTGFTTSGFSVGNTAYFANENAIPYASWTFRKQPKFFDVVTYTGTGSARTVAHNLGSVPSCIIVKATNATEFWYVYHRSLGNNNVINLNNTDASSSGIGYWNNTTPTSTVFSVGTDLGTNGSGTTYIAYLFAHDAGGFGLTGTDNVISCGSFTTDGSGNATVSLGYEPQWVLFKTTGVTGSWGIKDSMRGIVVDPAPNETPTLYADVSDADSNDDTIQLTSTGFKTQLATSKAYIYIAIRRGPMKVPTSGTEVFYPNAVAQADSPDSSGVPFPPDLINTFSRDGTNRTNKFSFFQFVDRLRGAGIPKNTRTAGTEGFGLVASGTNAEYGRSGSLTYVQLKANSQDITHGTGWNSTNYGNWIHYFWRRAPSFFDVVCYSGTASLRTVTHNLGVAPELMIIKSRGTARQWPVYTQPTGNAQALILNLSDAVNSTANDYFNSTSPTSTVFTLANFGDTNQNTVPYVAYLFATCAGVSKVFSYTGNGSSQTINCGFTSSARFVLIKRTDDVGDWYVWDSARGIVSGNDPHLSPNLTDVEVTTNDTIDTDSTGFVVNQVSATNVNVSSATYIGLAIA